MKKLVINFSVLLVFLSMVSVASAISVDINGYYFDLDQFNGATVTYRSDGSVSFDGKLWDNPVGVNNYTLGELAAGQYGTDPGDQVSLNDRGTPDWLQLNYATPFQVSSIAHTLVIYEISSYSDYVDTEGTSFNIKLNGGNLIAANQAQASKFNYPDVESTNQLVFDLYNFGFGDGDSLNTLYIENTDSGSSTSDPDFIFAGVANTAASPVPEPATILLLGAGLVGLVAVRRRKNSEA